MTRLLPWIFSSTLLVGCASTTSLTFEPAPDHPASPEASEAELALSAESLALENGSPPRSPAAEDHAKDPAPEGTVFVCPMHPDVVSNTLGNCPRCGMKHREKRPEAGGDHPHEH